MTGNGTAIYEEFAKRTNGSIYIGVVGPVRTGKSTFVKRFMETMVLPYITDPYQRERARDELPQSASGRTIMTSEPKFVPEEPVVIAPDETVSLSVRLIDSVGYMIPGAMGAEEDGQPRLVTTPWCPEEIPMTRAAEIGTKKVMEHHCSIGIVITTDGSITDIPREDYVQAEHQAIADMQATGKPFIILVNSRQPEGREAAAVRSHLEQSCNAACLCVDCQNMSVGQFQSILTSILYEFPMVEARFRVPGWLGAVAAEHPVKTELYDAIRKDAAMIQKLRNAESVFSEIEKLETVEKSVITEINPGSGIVICELKLLDGIYFGILSEQSGFPIEDESSLMELLSDLARTRRSYDKVAAALEQVRATGYGIVMPTTEEMCLEPPQIVRKGSSFGVRLKASAPSIHMMRADIQTEISPMVGDEKQSEDLLQYLLQEYEGDTGKLWQSNIFGKSVYELVSEGLNAKLTKMPEQSRYKLQNTLSRIINEGSSGLLCIILG